MAKVTMSTHELSKAHAGADSPLAGKDVCAPALCKVATEGLAAFRAACQPEALEATWATIEPSQNRNGVMVRGRPNPDSWYNVFRIDFTIVGVTAKQISAAFAYPARYAWDDSVECGTCIVGPTPVASEEAGTTIEVDLSSSCTCPAVGGIVSGRSFVDLRAVSISVDEATSLETHYAASQGLPTEMQIATPAAQMWLAAADGEKRTRARNLVGGGSRMVEYKLANGERAVDVLMIASTEIGGGLPVWLVNSETPKALLTMITNLKNHLEKGRGKGDGNGPTDLS